MPKILDLKLVCAYHRVNNFIMNVKKITEVTIFESPDGGRTVYARKSGSKTRELHYRDPELEKEYERIKRQQRWQAIFDAREANPGLNELCEQVEMFYVLSTATPPEDQGA